MNRYSLKRDILRATGGLDYLWKNINPGLYVFNYHRIGNPDETPFDPNIYSCDEIHFAKQIIAITELVLSKSLIEEQIKAPVEELAHPVGGRPTYTEETWSIAKECGYKVAFNFVPGYNPNPCISPFELLRIPIDDNWEPYDLKYTAVFAPVE